MKRTVVHFGAAIEVANRERGTHMAWDLWRMMKMENLEPNNHIFSSLITAAAIDKDVGTALKMLQTMEK